jgi:1-phosphofructokinase family hexose kinase
MIVAAGLSPAWQKIVVLDQLELGNVNRALEVATCSSGKVLNVAFALALLGAPVHVVTQIGGIHRAEIEEELAAHDIQASFVDATSPTRVCTTIVEHNGGRVTELVENARVITAQEIETFCQQFRTAAQRSELVIWSGSLPPGSPPELIYELIRDIACPSLLDIRGPELLAALAARPTIVKPNRSELATTLGRALNTDAALGAAMRELLDRGAEAVVVTSGSGPVWCATRQELFVAEPPRVEVVNSIGAGDCFAAAMGRAKAAGKSWRESVAQGVAAGAASAAVLSPWQFDPQQQASLAERIVISDR